MPRTGASSSSVPFIDMDEWRETPRRHRYVHGGFEGTHTRFSFYFPPEELYRNRFFQYLEGGAGGHENLLAIGYDGTGMAWMFDLAYDELGGYLVESNPGHFPNGGTGFANAYELFGASADSAVYARELAAEMYGSDAPITGYVWGVSGGGVRSGHCTERRPDVWQGGAPHMGVGMTNDHWSAWARLWAHAGDKFPQIIDACEPGGSGDPFEGLSNLQREALADLYRRGWPRGAENQLCPFYSWAFNMTHVRQGDPEYFEDFWTKPGYLGHDDPRALDAILVEGRAVVTRTFPVSESGDLGAQMMTRLATAGAAGAEPTWSLTLDMAETDRLMMADVTIASGEAAGRKVTVTSVIDGVISPFAEVVPEAFNDVVVGDEVDVSNREFIAWCHYHWYSIERREGGIVDQTLAPWAVDGRAIYPQRKLDHLVGHSEPRVYQAQVENKMICVQASLDAQVWPNSIYGYEEYLRKNMGDQADEHYRLYLVENAAHGTPEFIGPVLTPEKDPGVWRSRLVSYDPFSAQTLRDL